MTDAASGSLADRDWRLIRDDARDGATQMALEEVAAETAITDGIRTVRTFRGSQAPSRLATAKTPRRSTGAFASARHRRHPQTDRRWRDLSRPLCGHFLHDCRARRRGPGGPEWTVTTCSASRFSRRSTDSASTPTSRRASRTRFTSPPAICGTFIRHTISSHRQGLQTQPVRRRSAATPSTASAMSSFSTVL